MSVLHRNICCLLALLLVVGDGFSQGSCPENIGFERGDFTRWNCYTGTVNVVSGVSVSLSGPVNGRHTMLRNIIPQEKDMYGNFPVNCPNGSGYSIKLGNNEVEAQAERVSYTFVVPADKNEYSIIYNYAIVFQNPNHLLEEQPKFSSRVYDQTAGQYLSCGAFEFVASSGLPGFERSTLDGTVYYKPWSPVTIKLIGAAGKTITIEFTVNDCTRGGHFGYAYLDVNENCSAPITGNVFCSGATALTLQAPFGFQSYRWYSADFATFYGSGHNLYLNPIPPVGTRFAVEIMPFPGLGCPDTLFTTIERSNQNFNFQLADTLEQCLGFPANLTLPAVTQGSSPGLSLSYHLDSNAFEYLPTPVHVTDAGTYYVKAVNAAGCTETRPIHLRFPDVALNVNEPPTGCSPGTVDLTAPAVTAGSDPSLKFTYWKNGGATDPIPDPGAIDQSGTYFIKGTNHICSKTEQVEVKILTADDLKVQAASGCGWVDLTLADITAGSAPSFKYSYWKNAAAGIALEDPKKVTVSGTYYVKGTTNEGCSFVKPADITVKPLPAFTVNQPPAVTAPEKTSILNAATAAQPYTYTYWTNPQATQALATPGSIDQSGTFYIKARDTAGCESIQAVKAVVTVPYHPVIKYPNAFSPNGDGVNDRFRVEVAGNISFKSLTVFDRWGQKVFVSRLLTEYWTGERNGRPLAPGTYYWMVELVNNNNQEFHRKTGTITLFR